MVNKQKPYLGGIQEFSATAYVKDLKARKLDARAQLGRFVGYDLESKGYRIYWPGKRSISVERNVIFNQDNVQTAEKTTTIPGDLLVKGERNKVIQQPQNEENPENNTGTSQNNIQTQDEPTKTYQEDQPLNSVPFPSSTTNPRCRFRT